VSLVRFDDVEAAVAEVPIMTAKQGRRVYEFLVEHKLSRVLELGFAHGKSTCYLAAAVAALGGGQVVTMDMASAVKRSPNVHQLLDKAGLTEWVTPVFAETSHTWELMKLLERDPQPRFDFAYIDDAHTWDVTGFGFLLVDRLLAPGGWIVFDDLDWTIATSPGLRDIDWAKRLPEEQRTTPQVRKVIELLVATHPGYDQLREEDGWVWARKRPNRWVPFRRASPVLSQGVPRVRARGAARA
jgi:predicted O-methyltransferase YrrM